MTDEEQQPSQLVQLSEPFPREQQKRHPAKGLTYIPIAEVIARLNRILGPGNWNTQIMETREYGKRECAQGTFPTWVVAHVRLTGTIDGRPFAFDGMGGQDVNFLRAADNGPKDALSKGPVDIGDSIKGACSDATKKAAQSLGVALDLAREDDAMAYEQALLQANEPKATEATLEVIENFIKALPKDDPKRKEFVVFWAKLTGDGAPVGKKFGSGQVTVKEADDAMKWLGLTAGPKVSARKDPDPETSGEESGAG